MGQKQVTQGRKQASTRRWLACFTLRDTDDREGSFQVVLVAPSASVALKRLKERLKELRATTTLFSKGCEIYLERLLDITIDGKPALVNYVSGLKPVETTFLYCAVPEQEDVEIDVYGPKAEDADEYELEPFLAFKPRKTKGKRSTSGSSRVAH